MPSEMPGAVIEGLFLSNDEDAAFIESDIADETIVGAYEASHHSLLQRISWMKNLPVTAGRVVCAARDRHERLA